MNMITRLKKLEKWLCPAPTVPVHVYIVIPGCRVVAGKVYREDQFPMGSDVPLAGAQFATPELSSECKDADGRIKQRCYLCAMPSS